MAKLLIVEPHCSGHRMQYVRWISREATAEGYEVQLATFPESLDHPLYSVMQSECQGSICPLLLPKHKDLADETLLNRSGTLKLLTRELSYHKLYSSFFRQMPSEERPDFVLVPYLDYLAYAVALLGSPFGNTPWAGIVMRPSFHLEAMEVAGPQSRLHRPKERLFIRLLKNGSLTRLFSIDEALVRYVAREYPEKVPRLRYLPDPAELRGNESPESAREILNIPEDAVVILVYGALTYRKGIEDLLYATQEERFPPEVHIVLAGRQAGEVKELLQCSLADELRASGRLHEHDRFLRDEEEYAAFLAADIVWMGYRGHFGVSGILVQAGMMRLPVVACSEGMIGWQTRKHRLGLSVKINDPSAVAEAIATLARSCETSKVFGESGKRFAASHTPGDFSELIVNELKATLAER